MMKGGSLPILLACTLIIIIDHGPEMRIVGANSFVASQLILALDHLKRMHIEVVFQGEVNIDFASPYQ